MRWRQIITTDSRRNKVLELSYINQIIEFGVKKKNLPLGPDGFFVNGILVNGVQQVKRITQHFQVWFKIKIGLKSINVTYCVNKTKEKSHMAISIEAEKSIWTNSKLICNNSHKTLTTFCFVCLFFWSKIHHVCSLLLLLLSHFSRVRLYATQSLGFSRREHWSGLPFPSPMHKSEKWKRSRSVMADSSRPHGLQPTRLLRPWDFPGKSTGVGCHCLLQYAA